MRGFVRHGPRMRSRHIPRKVHQYVHGWRRSKSKFPKLCSTSKGVRQKTRLCHAFPFFFFSFSLPTQQVPERRACIDGNFPCVLLRCGCFAKSRCARGQARYIDSVFTVSSVVFLFFPFPFFYMLAIRTVLARRISLSQLQRRADSGGPSIRTDDGNVVIAVNGAGKQIGYRIGDADIVSGSRAKHYVLHPQPNRVSLYLFLLLLFVFFFLLFMRCWLTITTLSTLFHKKVLENSLSCQKKKIFFFHKV